MTRIERRPCAIFGHEDHQPFRVGGSGKADGTIARRTSEKLRQHAEAARVVAERARIAAEHAASSTPGGNCRKIVRQLAGLKKRRTIDWQHLHHADALRDYRRRMKDRSILFCTDFSRLSDGALPLATMLAREKQADLIVLHVQEPPTAYMAGEFYYGPLEPDKEALNQLLNRVVSADPNVACKHEMALGDPPTEILRVAKDNHVEMIVMSSHGRTGLERILLGSVAEKVVRRAKCPVLIFKQPHLD